YFDPFIKRVHDLVDVLCAKPVLGAVLHETATGVNHEDALARMSILFVYDDDAGRNSCAVKQIGWQPNDALNVALPHEGAADVRLCIATEQHAMRQNTRAFASGLERTNNVEQIRVVTLLTRRGAEWLEALVRIVKRIEPRAPALVGKRRIGDDVVEGLERVAVLILGVGQCIALHDERRG